MESFSTDKPTYRVQGIDILRGLVMVIMALDHTREFFHADAYMHDPLDLKTTSPVLFLTRWITHFCAPVFVFLAGTSAYLQLKRKTRSELSRFLISRGIWLILVEIVLMGFLMTLDPGYTYLVLSVLWAIGISMVLLGLMVFLPHWVILMAGLIIVFGHNLLDPYEKGQQLLPAWYQLLHRPSVLPVSEQFFIGNFYPFPVWTGVLFLGFSFGRLFKEDKPGRLRLKIAVTGAIVLGIFILLRAFNVYGDPSNWERQKTFLYSLFSFVNTNKYPPSLLFLTMTIGPALLLLAAFGNGSGRIGSFLKVYGRVPFFFYILHFLLIRILSVIAFMLNGHTFKEGAAGVPGFPFKFIIPGEGFSLGVVYLVWIFVVLLFYPLCKWFGKYRKENPKWWLSYF